MTVGTVMAYLAMVSGLVCSPASMRFQRLLIIRGEQLNQQDHLALQLSRLKSPDELEQKGEGLTFLFSKGGAGKFTSATATHRLSPGDVLVFNRIIGGKIAVFDNKPEFLFWSFSVCFEHLLSLFSSNEVSLLHKLTESLKVSKVYPASSPLAVEWQRLLGLVTPEFNLDHRGQLIRIAASILSVEFKDAQHQRGGYVRAEDHMVQVFEKLSASELINLSVGELADRFGCSRRHLNRLFHQHFGVSVASLRMEMRLLKAVSLLRDADAKIINVAEQCGFNHLGLFNTCFKRRFGTSPGQWRKTSMQVGQAPASKLDHKPTGKTAGKSTGKPAPQPVCPLLETGACPLSERHNPAATAPGVMATFANKLPDGTEVIEDLKRRDLMFGRHPLPNAESGVPEKRAGE